LSHFKTNTVWLGEIFEASGVTQSHSKLEEFYPLYEIVYVSILFGTDYNNK